jgi:3-methyladenine DNA glycosylase AlkD
VIHRALVSAVVRELASAADAGKAGAMQAYMKSALPYYGVTSPQQQKIWRHLFREHRIDKQGSWRDTVLELWRKAKFREERYAAIALTSETLYPEFQTVDEIPLYDQLIVTGAWWDYVDVIASRRIGFLLRRYPRALKPQLRRWSRDGDMWRRRTAILAQLGFKRETDLELLYDCIEPNLEDSQFFIRKAIGWALRQYAWSNPAEVRRYVRAHRDRLSGQSVREALKNIGAGTGQ